MDRPRVMSNDIVPMEALAYMRKHYPGKRFLNEFYLGGYMIYFNRDVQQVFSDGRAGTVYSEADLKELIDLINNRNTEKIFRKYNFDGVFIKPRHRIFLLEEIHDTSRWKKTFDDGNFAIYMRRSLTEGP
jgi:hypothetical protein